ncbi:MAG: CRISPR-associated protein Cmr1 [Thermococcaceae archaeon]|nr:CRISPR-associated protein Cmr1 [Thermococcaceae archaeon]
MMYKAEFELEAITPIFMRGANQNRAEIRAPSIKGVMRWWFRALAGNYFGSDIVGLRKAEEYVFGSTNQRNRVEVHVDCNQKPRDIIVKFKGNRPIFDKYSHIHELLYMVLFKDFGFEGAN